MKTQLLRFFPSMLGLIFWIPMLTQNNWSYSQCSGTLADPNCATIVAPEVFEGVVIATGETYVVSAPVSLNAITIAGGQLIVCSDLTLNTLTFNGGNLLVASSGTFNVTNGGAALVLGANSTINNYGTMTLACSIVSGPNNIIANCINSAVFAVPFNQIVMQGPNSQFINNGTVQSSFIVNTSNNTIVPWCLGAGSQTITGIMINQYNVGFSVPEANACLNITNFISNSAPLTNSSFLLLCYNASSVTVSGAPNFGNATVFPNNPSCSIALGPLSQFFGKANGKDVELNWRLELPETSVDRVIVTKYSDETHQFEEIATLKYGHSTSISNYTDLQAISDLKLYYRLKIITTDNVTDFSDIVKIDPERLANPVFYPNPFHDVLYCSNEILVKEVYTMDAKACPFEQKDSAIFFQSKPQQGLIIIYEINGKTMMERVLIN